MLYAEIIRALPRDVSQLLQEKLDNTYVNSDLNEDEVIDAIARAARETRDEARYDTETSRAMASMLLNMVPEAGAKFLLS